MIVRQLLLLRTRPPQICPLSDMAINHVRRGRQLPMVLLVSAGKLQARLPPVY
jgi:hypothetical protein